MATQEPNGKVAVTERPAAQPPAGAPFNLSGSDGAAAGGEAGEAGRYDDPRYGLNGQSPSPSGGRFAHGPASAHLRASFAVPYAEHSRLLPVDRCWLVATEACPDAWVDQHARCSGAPVRRHQLAVRNVHGAVHAACGACALVF